MYFQPLPGVTGACLTPARRVTAGRGDAYSVGTSPGHPRLGRGGIRWARLAGMQHVARLENRLSVP